MTRKCHTLLLHADGMQDRELEYTEGMSRFAKQHPGVYGSSRINGTLHVYVRSVDWFNRLLTAIDRKKMR